VFSVVARSLSHRSPPRRGGGSYPHESIPLRVLHVLPAVQPVGWTCSPRILRPVDDIPRASPVRGRQSCPPRFRSQAFSASQRFPSRPELRGLVSCRNRPKASSLLQSFPLAQSRAPLSRPLAPLRLSTAVPSAPATALSPSVSSDAHARMNVVACFPRRLWAPFPRAEARFPVPLDVRWWSRSLRRLHPLRSFVPLCESVHVGPSCPGTVGRYSPGLFAPLKLSPPAPRDLEPASPRGSEHRSRANACERRHGTSRPHAPGEPILRAPKHPRTTSSAVYRPPSRPDRATSRQPPSSHGLGRRAHPPA
jgi:hypothetical protein